jgi:hypothetical protein
MRNRGYSVHLVEQELSRPVIHFHAIECAPPFCAWIGPRYSLNKAIRQPLIEIICTNPSSDRSHKALIQADSIAISLLRSQAV